MTTLEQYQEALRGIYCRWCGNDLSTRSIQHYDHAGGYKVKNYKEKQWLYVECGSCKYQWSLQKLGIK